MIGRSDGGFAGGVLPITAEMQQHGARPTWLGYIYVEDVDASVQAIEQAGGKTCMAAIDIPNVGRVAMVTDPQGAPFYVMKPIPPAERSERRKRRLLARAPSSASRWNELSTSDPDAAGASTASSSAGAGGDMTMGEHGQISLLRAHGHAIGAVVGKMPRTAGRTGAITSASTSIAAAKQAAKAGGGQISRADGDARRRFAS